MPTVEQTTVLDRINSLDTKTDPRNYRNNTIDPLEIYGVVEAIKNAQDTGDPVYIANHPEFINPREVPNQDTIDSIKEAGEIDEAIKLYWTAQNDVVVVDGRTRLFAIVQDLVENPTTDRWARVPYQRVRATSPDEVRILMLKLNLDDTRTALTSYEVASTIDRLEKQGLTEQYIASKLNKIGKGGVAYVRKYKALLNANPAVIEAVKEGKIDEGSAFRIAKTADFDKQMDAVSKVQEALEAGETPAKARQIAGVKKPNNGTLGFRDTYHNMVENYYRDYRIIVELDKEDTNRYNKIDWTNAQQRDDFHTELIITTAYQLHAIHLKIDELTLKQQFQWIDERLEDGQQSIIQGLKPLIELFPEGG